MKLVRAWQIITTDGRVWWGGLPEMGKRAAPPGHGQEAHQGSQGPRALLLLPRDALTISCDQGERVSGKAR